MFPLLAISLIALVGWLAWRGARREISRVNDELNNSKRPADETRQGTTLKQDPKTGVYRAEEDGE